MSMGGVKETQCTTCVHREVCAFKSDFLTAQETVDRLDISTGDKTFVRLCDIPFICPVELKCRFYMKKEPTVR